MLEDTEHEGAYICEMMNKAKDEDSVCGLAFGTHKD